jgi:DNA segregation ATPase FtsK/SpoIIIE, S-DNA-T family
VQRVCDFLRSKGAPDYVEGMLTGESEVSADSAWSVDGVVPSENGDGEKDALYDQAVVIVMQNRKASISLVQRHLRIGYNRSARLLEQMEKSGLIGALEPNGSRAVLVPSRD